LYDTPSQEPQNGKGPKKVQTAKAPVKKAPEKTAMGPAYNFAGCFAGGYFGGAFAPDVQATDPTSTGGTFYNAPFANATNGGFYRVPFNKISPMAGATLGCNWQARGSSVRFGAEAETGNLRLSAAATDPYSAGYNNDTLDKTVIGNWYGAIAGRAGLAAERSLFYAKAGVGFTGLKQAVTDTCNTGACSTGLLNASNSDTRAFLVAGGGIEWAFTGKWTVKMGYLFLDLKGSHAVCGAGGGTAAGATFCSNHTLNGVHTTKLGLNYKLY